MSTFADLETAPGGYQTIGDAAEGKRLDTRDALCPRCGTSAIEVKDWGQAGRLYVHRRTVEQGIPVQDACQISAAELQHGPRWTRKG